MSHGYRNEHFQKILINEFGRHVPRSICEKKDRVRQCSYSNIGSRRTIIRNQPIAPDAFASNAQLKQQVLGKNKRHKKAFSKPKLATFAAYSGIFVLIISIVAIGYRQPQPAQVASVAQSSNTGVNVDRPSVDEVVATDIAANFAEQTNMPVAANVANLSVSLAAKTELSQTTEAAISKPQIIQATAASRDITSYTAKAGDTAQSIAAAHSISPETLKWANNLSSDAIEANKVLTVPPVDGVVYTIKDGDTPEKIASTFKADKDRIVSFNDLEIDGLTKDRRIVIPAGVLPEDQRPGYQAPSTARASTGTSYGANNSGGYTISRGMANVSSGNAYAFGNCTWYAYERRAQLGRPVGSFWGNAATWAMYARAAGFAVNNTPAVGAVMQNGGGYGHVAIVEEVLPNGDIRISEMNYYGGGGGFNIVSGRTVSGGQAKSYNYIHQNN